MVAQELLRFMLSFRCVPLVLEVRACQASPSFYECSCVNHYLPLPLGICLRHSYPALCCRPGSCYLPSNQKGGEYGFSSGNDASGRREKLSDCGNFVGRMKKNAMHQLLWYGTASERQYDLPGSETHARMEYHASITYRYPFELSIWMLTTYTYHFPIRVSLRESGFTFTVSHCIR